MIYVYDTEAVAESIRLTIQHLGGYAERIGSAVRTDHEMYSDLLEHTYAPPATWVASTGEER